MVVDVLIQIPDKAMHCGSHAVVSRVPNGRTVPLARPSLDHLVHLHDGLQTYSECLMGL